MYKVLASKPVNLQKTELVVVKTVENIRSYPGDENFDIVQFENEPTKFYIVYNPIKTIKVGDCLLCIDAGASVLNVSLAIPPHILGKIVSGGEIETRAHLPVKPEELEIGGRTIFTSGIAIRVEDLNQVAFKKIGQNLGKVIVDFPTDLEQKSEDLARIAMFLTSHAPKGVTLGDILKVQPTTLDADQQREAGFGACSVGGLSVAFSSTALPHAKSLKGNSLGHFRTAPVWELSRKIDGMAVTIWIDKKGDVRVFTKEHEIDLESKQPDILRVLKAVKSLRECIVGKPQLRDLAISMELSGPGIGLNLDGSVGLMAYRVINTAEKTGAGHLGRTLSYEDSQKIAAELGLPYVQNHKFDVSALQLDPNSVEQLLLNITTDQRVLSLLFPNSTPETRPLFEGVVVAITTEHGDVHKCRVLEPDYQTKLQEKIDQIKARKKSKETAPMPKAE